MICRCGGIFRVLKTITAVDSARRRVCCEKCGRQSYSVEQIYAERTPRPSLRETATRKKATGGLRATGGLLPR